MKNILITPSFAPDFYRCKAMLDSASRWVQSADEHILIIDRRDSEMFESLAGGRVRLICKEDVLPLWLCQIPCQRRWWLTDKSLPVRGWILQQIIKLAVAQQSDADAAIFVDSDVCFIRPLDLNDLWVNGNLRLFRTQRGPNQFSCKRHKNWYSFASSALFIEDGEKQQSSFIAQLTSMRPDVVRQMCDELEVRFSRPWYDLLLNSWDFSEFILYGLYVEKLGAERAGHFFSDQQLCHSSWFYDLKSEKDVSKFVLATSHQHCAVHLQSNLGFNELQFS